MEEDGLTKNPWRERGLESSIAALKGRNWLHRRPCKQNSRSHHNAFTVVSVVSFLSWKKWVLHLTWSCVEVVRPNGIEMAKLELLRA